MDSTTTTISVDDVTHSTSSTPGINGSPNPQTTDVSNGLLDPHVTSGRAEADAVSMVSLRSVHAHRVVELQMMHTRRIEMQNQAMRRPRPSTAVLARRRSFKVYAFDASEASAEDRTLTWSSKHVLVRDHAGSDGKIRTTKYHLDGVGNTYEAIYDKSVRHVINSTFRGYNGAVLLLGEGLTHGASSTDSSTTHTSLCASLLHRVCEQFLLRCDATVTSDAGMRLRARVRAAVYAVVDNDIVDCLTPDVRNDHVDTESVSFDADGNAMIEGITTEILHAVDNLRTLAEKVQRHLSLTKRSKSTDVTIIHELHLVKASSTDSSGKQATPSATSDDECISGVFKLVQLARITPDVLGSYVGESSCDTDVSQHQGVAGVVTVVQMLAQAQAQAQQQQTPYSRTTLTSILRNALGGNCKTSLVIGLRHPPAPEPASTASNGLLHGLLHFGVDARNIRNKATPSRTFMAQRALLIAYRRSLGLAVEDDDGIGSEGDSEADSSDNDSGTPVSPRLPTSPASVASTASSPRSQHAEVGFAGPDDGPDDVGGPSFAFPARGTNTGTAAGTLHRRNSTSPTPEGDNRRRHSGDSGSGGPNSPDNADRYISAVARKREAVAAAARADRAAEDALLQARAALHAANKEGQNHPDMVFAFTSTSSPTGATGKTTTEATGTTTALHDENARLRAQLQESRAEATYLANTDWSKLIRAVTDSTVGVHRVSDTDDSAADGVFCGSELAWWLSNNVQGVETTSEAAFIAGLLLRMHVFIPTNCDPTSFVPSDEAWYRFTNTSTRAGLKLTPAIANVVGGADTDDARDALYNRRGIWEAPQVFTYDDDDDARSLVAEAESRPLLQAIMLQKKRSAITALVKQHGPGVCDSKGRTALHYAVIMNAARVCRLLVKHGADVNGEDCHGATPLMYACLKMHIESLTTLLRCGADLRQADAYGQTALHWATRHYSTAVLKCLVSQKACTPFVANLQDFTGHMSPVHWAISAHAHTHVDILLKAGADPRILDKQGKTAMDYCIHYDSPESLVAILNAVPDGIHCRNSAGQTPLQAVCDSMHPSAGCFKLLLRAKAVDVNAADMRLRTPLHACAQTNRLRIAQLLLDRGAQPSVVDVFGKTPLVMALEKGFDEFAGMMLTSMQKQTTNSTVLRRLSQVSVSTLGSTQGHEAHIVSQAPPPYEASRSVSGQGDSLHAIDETDQLPEASEDDDDFDIDPTDIEPANSRPQIARQEHKRKPPDVASRKSSSVCAVM
eukprot:m.217272 g.217272  ORF g.217272 m.217272 type:complete len:1249 (-) comp19120_c0_seq1:80-3826(-)